MGQTDHLLGRMRDYVTGHAEIQPVHVPKSPVLLPTVAIWHRHHINYKYKLLIMHRTPWHMGQSR